MQEKRLGCPIRLVVGLACALLAASAGSGQEFGQASVAQSWNVAAEYPTTGNLGIDGAVREWLGQNIRNRITDSAGVAVNPAYRGGTWDMTVDYITSMPSDRAVSFVFETVVSPSGAAHPMSYVDVLSFDAVNGDALTIDEMFADPERALAIMAEHARELIVKDLRVTAPELAESLADETWVEKGLAPERKNYAAMVLAPEGVLVVFQKYQVLPYVYGFPEALFPLDLLKEAGPNRALWEKRKSARSFF